MMRILGLDPSLTSLGWALYDDHELIYQSGSIRSLLKDAERLANIRARLQKIIETTKPGRAVIEGYAYGAINRAHDQGEVGGLVRLLCYDLHIPYEIVPPSTLKKWTTGKGNAKKDYMLLRVYKRWGVEFETIDEADAYALARWGFEKYVVRGIG